MLGRLFGKTDEQTLHQLRGQMRDQLEAHLRGAGFDVTREPEVNHTPIDFLVSVGSGSFRVVIDLAYEDRPLQTEANLAAYHMSVYGAEAAVVLTQQKVEIELPERVRVCSPVDLVGTLRALENPDPAEARRMIEADLAEAAATMAARLRVAVANFGKQAGIEQVAPEVITGELTAAAKRALGLKATPKPNVRRP